MTVAQHFQPIVEITRIATHRGIIVGFGGAHWLAEEEEARRWHRSGTRFFMYAEEGGVVDVYLDERGLLTTVPTWRTSGDRPFYRQLWRLPRFNERETQLLDWLARA